ncbi:hypothetical protein AUP68_02314 [Ilyonectria robusta]
MPNKLKWRGTGRGGELDDLRAKMTRLEEEKDKLDDIIAGEEAYLHDQSEQKKQKEAAQSRLPYINEKIQVINLMILIKAEPERNPRVQQLERELKLATMKVELYEMDGPEQKRQELKAAIAKLDTEAGERP